MTGYGEAHRQEAGLAIAVEVRTINSRYFKLSVRAGETYAVLEPDIEGLVRQHVKRGTIQVSLRIDRGRRAEDYQLNAVALAAYREQLEKELREVAASEMWVAGQVVRSLRPERMAKSKG